MDENVKEKEAHSDRNIDPLGVIEHCAKQIWEERGKLAGTSWRDHFAEAEQLILAGRSSGELPSTRVTSEPALKTIPAEIWALRDQDRDRFAAAVARSIDNLLNEHESYCLGTLLLSNEFKLKGDTAYRACSEEQVADLLAALSADYDEDFIRKEGNGTLGAISAVTRARYWTEKIKAWRASDAPLNYSDRNTIDRLKDSLLGRTEIEGVRLHD